MRPRPEFFALGLSTTVFLGAAALALDGLITHDYDRVQNTIPLFAAASGVLGTQPLLALNDQNKNAAI